MSARTMPETVAPSHFPLAALLWPHRADGSSGLLRGVILVALGTALLTLSAKVNLPLPYVPMTLQTLVVLVIGAAYGWRLGSATLMTYLAEGASWISGLRRPGRRPRAVRRSDGRISLRLRGGGLRDGMAERARLGSIGAAAVRRDGVRTHSHSRRRIWLACVRHETRGRKGVAGRHCAVHRGVPDQECARRALVPAIRRIFDRAQLSGRPPTPLTSLAQSILAVCDGLAHARPVRDL